MTMPITAKNNNRVGVAPGKGLLCATRKLSARSVEREGRVCVLNYHFEKVFARAIAVPKGSVFTSESFTRPPEEKREFMKSLIISCVSCMKGVKGLRVKLHITGDRGQLPIPVLDLPARAEQSTLTNQILLLNVYINTVERRNNAQAVQAIASRVKAITELSSNWGKAKLYVGNPELLVRTGGKYCLSNFFSAASGRKKVVFFFLALVEFWRGGFGRSDCRVSKT